MTVKCCCTFREIPGCLDNIGEKFLIRWFGGDNFANVPMKNQTHNPNLLFPVVIDSHVIVVEVSHFVIYLKIHLRLFGEEF